jgi:hypothetical protein
MLRLVSENLQETKMQSDRSTAEKSQFVNVHSSYSPANKRLVLEIYFIEQLPEVSLLHSGLLDWVCIAM